MKFTIAILLTALVAYAAGLQLPWYTLAIAAALVAIIIPQKASKAFWAGFLGLFLLWAALSIASYNTGGKYIATQMAGILPLNGSATLLILVTSTVGAIVSGLAAYTGSLVRKLISKN